MSKQSSISKMAALWSRIKPQTTMIDPYVDKMLLLFVKFQDIIKMLGQNMARVINEIVAVWECSATWIGSYLPTFRHNISVSSSRRISSWAAWP
jgi:hypothetical protein